MSKLVEDSQDLVVGEQLEEDVIARHDIALQRKVSDNHTGCRKFSQSVANNERTSTSEHSKFCSLQFCRRDWHARC